VTASGFLLYEILEDSIFSEYAKSEAFDALGSCTSKF